MTKARDAGADAADEAQTPRRSLAVGALALLVGLGLVGTGESDLGMAIVLGALLVLIYGVHSFGRLGPDTGHA